MSKTRLIKFANELSKPELEEQLLDLYLRFKPVKEFYNFSFNPNEDKLFDAAKLKITKEYFPEGKRRAKKRRSIAQKEFEHLRKLEVDPFRLIDLMLYNIEIAQTYNEEKPISAEAFYKSMLSSFRKILVFTDQQQAIEEFKDRILGIKKTAFTQSWINAEAFQIAMNELLEN